MQPVSPPIALHRFSPLYCTWIYAAYAPSPPNGSVLACGNFDDGLSWEPYGTDLVWTEK